ncbi:ankyrin repeat-containing domain protein, partial [Lenzites betulinus]
SSGSVDIVRYLIDQGADVNRSDSGAWTPLHIAASGGFDEVVTELLGSGADVNQRNDKGLTPLYKYSQKLRTVHMLTL